MDVPSYYDIAGLRELLERQAGLVSSAQLRGLCLDPRVARRWVAAGRWQRPHRGVFAAFSGPLGRTAHVWAAILWATPDAVASHATAAELHGLTDRLDDRIHLTVPVSRRVRGQAGGVDVHYAHRLPLTRHPTANPPRTRLDDTVLDLVDVSSRARDVETWVTMAVQKRLTTSTRLADALMRRKKIRWRAMVEAMLVDVAEGAQSPLELRHLRAVERAHRLPAGVRQRRRAGERVIWVDVDYERYHTRVELDGRVGHDGEGRFRDRRRDNAGTVRGAWTLRYGHTEVFGEPCRVAQEQARVLRDRGWTGRPKRCGSTCAIR
ncbi:type IV toxin-antitoxin system AbiEi family antitoxin domain-containing protein [Jiangella alba]|uniref:Transcriptional regulator, AbiEi antitoxin, Type IV TA system n=1 Tax=Jiangella alba TaxID=561176 RepID=A0A1H5P368_9ACTN|nr:type IV toxin-antitoxin system AbiEi family antitoxin domain-containing protein [Jiangella alba]SEF08306.1 Transcriptional regulator, AbiEi antitoxin, Type IV TA system [Jiangella alba]